MRDDAPAGRGGRTIPVRLYFLQPILKLEFRLSVGYPVPFLRCCLRLSQAIVTRTASVVCALLLIVVPGFGATKHSPTTAPSKAQLSKTSKSSSKSAKSSKTTHTTAKSTSHSKKSRKVSKKTRGQQGIDPDRAREIQSALIREHYMDGEPSGTWDAQTKSALTKYQNDNGWQTKVLPDSRALIKLGLGPSKEGLLNPESAAIGNAHELGVEKDIPGGSVAPHK